MPRAKRRFVPGSIHNDSPYGYGDLEPSAYRGRQIIGGGTRMVGKAGPSGMRYGVGYVAPKRTLADTGVRYPAPKSRTVRGMGGVIRQAPPTAVIRPQRPTAVIAPKGTVTPPARPVAKKKAVAPKATPAAQRSRQIAR